MSFYMNMGVMTEGEQLERHNERKVKEKWKNKDDERKADDRHERIVSAYYDKQSDADKKRLEKEYNRYERDYNKSNADYSTKVNSDISALKRAAKDIGIRPKHEYGIFSECYFINEGQQKQDYIKRKYVDSYYKNKDDERKADDRRERVTSAYYDKQSDADKRKIEKTYDKYLKDLDRQDDYSSSRGKGLDYYKTDSKYQTASHAATAALKRAAKDVGANPKY